MSSKKERHILSLSGGKDSTALAVYMRDRVSEMEYVFCDTGKELPETYDYLEKVEAFLGKPIIRLNATRDFDHWLEIFGGFLPSPQMRWCTKMLKIKPFEAYVGEGTVYSYIGIRADENRHGYISHKENIIPVYPFKENGIDLHGVRHILEESGLGYPEYYKWRTRSGCYFCFFQRKAEWIGLLENHPNLFCEAKKYEKADSANGKSFTWSQNGSLEELEDNKEQILDKHHNAMKQKIQAENRPLLNALEELLDEEDDEQGCHICHL